MEGVERELQVVIEERQAGELDVLKLHYLYISLEATSAWYSPTVPLA